MHLLKLPVNSYTKCIYAIFKHYFQNFESCATEKFISEIVRSPAGLWAKQIYNGNFRKHSLQALDKMKVYQMGNKRKNLEKVSIYCKWELYQTWPPALFLQFEISFTTNSTMIARGHWRELYDVHRFSWTPIISLQFVVKMNLFILNKFTIYCKWPCILTPRS